jgi:biopolymer transport protein ExbD
MNFSSSRPHDELEINLIPLIDILLVVLIFLAATTSFVQANQLKITLPQAAADTHPTEPLNIAISQDNRYALNGVLIDAATPAELAASLRRTIAGRTEPQLVINADALAAHQSVVHVMTAAKLAGIHRLSFATQSQP